MQRVIELQEKIHYLLDNSKFEDALKELQAQLSKVSSMDEESISLLAEIAGSYISLGSESYDIKAVEKGISIFQDNREILKTQVSEDSIEYCLGNGFHAIYKIETSQVKDFFPTPDKVRNSLFEAKQAYFKAYKVINLENLNNYSIQVLTNLGNNLNQSGRIVESLQLFDLVLQENPTFPQAVVSKADGLRYMISITNCPITISLIAEMYRLYSIGDQAQIHNEKIQIKIKKGLANSSQFLINNEIDLNNLKTEFGLNEIEYLNHPEELKFYLDNYLSLSEHGLFCKCNGAQIDNLAIGFRGFSTSNKKLIQLELLNNRLKSEFDLARKLYFDFCSNQSSSYVYYEEFIPGIQNDINTEKLRASYRYCFGILDKIAEGICFLLDLNVGKKESIYFENFWGFQSNAPRWEKINKFRNIHLTALYSIACDLNKKNGEFGFYKIWRNRLEHGLFSITNFSYSPNDWEDEKFSENTSNLEFEKRTKHLLQLVRASIFSFVFCVRHELITMEESGSS